MHTATNHTPLLTPDAARHETVLVWLQHVTEPKTRSLDHHQTDTRILTGKKYPEARSCYSHLHIPPNEAKVLNTTPTTATLYAVIQQHHSLTYRGQG